MALTVADIEAAITLVLSGQSVSIGGVSYSRANLDSLVKLRNQIKSEYAATGGTRPAIRAINFGSMGY